MPVPDLGRARNESAWERAKRDAAGVYRSPLFGIAAALVTLMAAPLAAILATGSPLLVSIVAGAGAIALTLVAVLAVQVAAAPVRQRDTLRQRWPSGPIEGPPDVELSIRNYIRQGGILCHRIDGARTRADSDKAAEWAEEVARFLSTHSTSVAARAFLTCTEGQGTSPYQQISAQLDTLRRIVGTLKPDDSN